MDQKTVWAFLWTGLALVTAQLLFILIRRTRGSHKRLPPGPKPWPILGNLGNLDGVSHQAFAKLSSQHGSLIHLSLGSVPLIVAHSSDLAKEILKTKDIIFASRPRNTASKELMYDHNTMSSSPAGPKFRTLRKMFSGELLTPKRIKNFQAVRKEEARIALKVLLKESQGKSLVQVAGPLKDHIGNVLTTMIMSKKLFGPEADDATDSTKFQAIVQSLLGLIGVFHFGDFIPLFKYWDVQGHIKAMRETHSELDEFFQSILDDRQRILEKGEGTGHSDEQADFLDTVVTRSGENDEHVLTNENVKGILGETVVAGAFSTSSAVEWSLAELLRHSEVLKKAQEELDSVVGRERFVEESDIPQLPYIQAIVKESLRLHPVTPMLVPHLNTEDCEVGGFHIPANSQVMVNVWAIGRDPKLWKNPLEFNPERFLDSSIDVMGHHYELLPFGSGRRKCPGLALALLIVQYYVAFFVQTCDWSLPPGQLADAIDMSDGIGIVNHKAVPLEAILSPRLPKHVLYPSAPE